MLMRELTKMATGTAFHKNLTQVMQALFTLHALLMSTDQLTAATDQVTVASCVLPCDLAPSLQPETFFHIAHTVWPIA